MRITAGLIYVSLSTVAITLGGCASQPTLTQEQILGQNQKVASLNTALQKARANDANLLAPESYARAATLLDQAMDAARNNRNEDANADATEGLKAIDKLNHDASTTREIMGEVLHARDLAYQAGAKSLQGGKIADLDENLKRTAMMIEEGDLERAKQRRPGLIADYQQIHLVALKKNTMNLAKSALADAKQQRATKYAPKTLAEAEQELALAVTILDADRSQTEKATLHANKAKWLAERSASITETIKDFDRRNYTMEDIVLWHQQQLQSINEPLGGELPFNEPSNKVTLGLRSAVDTLVNERNMTRAQLQEVEQLSRVQQHSAEQRIAAIELEKQKEREAQQKFISVSSLFTEYEANVYRQGQNVLISAQGFQFPPGQSEIQANNFPLMNKIIRAIKIFPNAFIEISGHTDAMGDDASNQLLSEHRADKVAKFLTEVGDIPASRITSRGYGESRPVASNETQEGRAKNRRVEIKIVNE